MKPSKSLRSDHSLISTLIEENSSVLDIGCGDGQLLAHLRDTKGVRGFGLEISSEDVGHAVSAGLSVVQGDANVDLAEYPDGSFDTVILSNSLQALDRPDAAIHSAMRIAKRAIVSFPNFGHWRVRLHLLAHGRMPVSKALPASWYETTNIHLCTVRDFLALVDEMNINVDQAFGLYSDRPPRAFSLKTPGFTNLSAEAALFVLSRP